MIKDFTDGITGYLKVIRYSSQYRLWKYLFYSGLISLFLAVAIVFAGIKFGDNLGEGLFSWYKWEWGSQIIESVDAWLGAIIIIALSLILFKYLVLILTSPVMSFLSEQLERQISHYPPHTSFTISQVISDFKRGLALNIRNLFKELFWTLILLILGLFPLFTLFTTPMIFLVQSYYAGAGNLDFFLERHCNVRESVRFTRKHRFLTIGNGIGFMLLLLLPFVGWFVAPYFSTISGTIAGVDRINDFRR